MQLPTFRRLLVAGLCAVSLGSAAASHSLAETIAFTGGTVITVSGETLEDATVLVRDGRIARIGSAADFADLPEGTRVVDLDGRYLMPGIIDTHSHMGVYPWTIARGNGDGNEATDPTTPDVRAEDAVFVEDPAFERARAGGVTSAFLLPGSANLVGGEGVVVKLRPGASMSELRFQGAPRQIKMAMGENPKRVYGGKDRRPSTRMGNIAYLRERFTQARLYRKDWERFRALAKPKPGQRPDYDAGLEILADVLEGEVRVQVHCYTRSDIEALLRLADEMKFQVAAIHHALEAYKVAPLLAEKGVGVCTWADWWGFKQEAVDGIPANASICTQSGVVVAIHSDSASDIQRLPHEAAKAVRAGLSPEDAIRAITLNAAKILGIDGQVGSIEVGKQADFAVFTKHPLDAFARCDLTVVDGQVVYDRAIAEAAQALTREALTIPLERAPAPGFLIEGATVHPVSSPPFENGFVVVQEGRITHAGPDMPEDARDLVVVNAMGLHVYPGLIDTGCQVGLVEVSSDPNLNESGSARLFAADTRVTDGLNPDSRTIAVARSTGVTTALIVPGGNPIAGLGAVIDLEGPTAASMIARDAAVLSVNLTGRTRGRARGEKKGGTRTELLRELRREFHEALRHKEKIEAYERKKARYEAKQAERARKAESKGEGENPDSESNEDPDGEEDKKKDEEKEPPTAPDRKPHLDAMLLALSGEIPVLVSAHTAHDIQLALSLADEFSLRLILSQGTEAYRMREQLAERKIPITFGPFTTQPSGYETRNAIYESPALLHEAGILFSLRTGSTHNVARLPSHAGLTVAYGLAEEAALRAITLDAAKVLGIDEDYGSIEVGKIANLVVTDGDILQPTTQVKRLFIRGREVGLSSHQSELGDRYRTK